MKVILIILLISTLCLQLTNVYAYDNLNPLLAQIISNPHLPTIIVIGDNAAESDIKSANMLQKKLQDFIDPNKLQIRKDVSIENYEKRNSNLIIIGGPSINRLSEELNNSLTVQFERAKEQFNTTIDLADTRVVNLVNSKTGFKYGEKFRDNFGLGFVEILRDHYRQDQVILVIAGIEAKGTLSATEYLISNPTHYQKINGDIAIIYNTNGQNIAIDPHLSINTMSLDFFAYRNEIQEIELSNGGKSVNEIILSTDDSRIKIGNTKVMLNPGDIISIPISVSFDTDVDNQGIIEITSSLGIEKSLIVNFHEKAPRLIIEKILDKETYTIDDSFTVTIRIKNIGNDEANNVKINDSVYDWMSIDTPLQSDIGTLKINEIRSITYSGSIINWHDPGNYFLKRTTVTYENYDNELFLSESDDVIFKLQGLSKILTMIKVDSENVDSGSEFDVHVILENDINQIVGIDEVKIIVPPGFSSKATSPKGGYDMGFGSQWSFNELKPKETIDLYAKITAPTYLIGMDVIKQQITLEGTISSSGYNKTDVVNQMQTIKEDRIINVKPTLLFEKDKMLAPLITSVVGFFVGILSRRIKHLLKKNKIIRKILRDN